METFAELHRVGRLGDASRGPEQFEEAVAEAVAGDQVGARGITQKYDTPKGRYL